MVYLIGAGPGDVGLITVKGANCLAQAQVVIYDNLANPALLKYCSPTTEKIYVGKKANNHTLKQEEINALLVEKAKDGAIVARLKGGDPYVFGRGSEEAQVLRQHNIPFEVVPGITAGIAAPAYSGIPFTHRGITATAAFVTGHEDPNKADSDINWAALAGIGTLVFYMGVKNLPNIATQLIHHGRSPQTPVALVRYGSWPQQTTLTGTLETIAQKAADANLQPPVITIVGEVVDLRDSLRWFDNRPLFGKQIVVTRSRTQASDLTARLTALGADVLELPTIDIAPVRDFSELDSRISTIQKYAWLVFTSVNGVDIFFGRMRELGLDARALHGVRCAVIGSETGRRLQAFGIQSDLVPSQYTSQGVVDAFSSFSASLKGAKVLIPTSEIGRDVIADALRTYGAEVEKLTIYTNQLPTPDADTVARLSNRPPDLVTFTSSSTVTNFVEVLQSAGLSNLISKLPVASIGPVTSQTAREAGFTLSLEAPKATIEELVKSVEEYFAL